MNIKTIAEDFLQLCASGEVASAFNQYVDAASFVHHNPYFRSDAESLKQGMQGSANTHPNKQFAIQRSIQENDLVAVHSHIKFNADAAGIAVVHIARFDGEKIVELWDIGQAVPDNLINESGMF